MLMRLLGLALIIGVLGDMQVRTPPAQKKRHAEAPLVWSGNQLFDLCQHYRTEKLTGSLGAGCFMYISGATQTLLLTDDADTMMMSPCPRKEVTPDQITDVVLKWLGDHPEKRDLPAPYIVMKALNDAFPCN